MNHGKIYARIAGTGSYLPDRVLTNFELEKKVDTNNQWIVERTGIKERRIAGDSDATSDLATQAALNACENAGILPEDIDLIIVSTVTPDMIFPSTACIVQKNIGAYSAAAFDMEAACTGFIYGMTVASQFIENGYYENALVIGADVLSRVTDWEDRNTCVLFGDGAGAVVLTSDAESGILSTFLASDGNGDRFVYCPAGGSRLPASHETVENRLHYTNMNGGEVFKFAVKILPTAVLSALKKCGMEAANIDWLIPHQANMRIIQSASKRLDIPDNRVAVTIDKYGNNASASIPIALDEYSRGGRIKNGEVLALVGFGSGLTWGSAIVKWKR